MSGRTRSPEGPQSAETRQLALSLQGFAWEALEAECTRLGISAEELVGHAIAYYLADLDSGRIARELPPRPPGPPLSRS